MATLAAALFLVVWFGLVHKDGVQPNEESDIFQRLLALVPDEPDSRGWVSVIDYDRSLERLGIERPGNPLDASAASKFDAALEAAGADIWGLTLLSGYGPDQRAISLDGIGYTTASVRGEIRAGADSLSSYDAVVGDFDARKSEEVTAECAACGVVRDSIDYKGDTYYAWGADYQNHLRTRLVAPAFDELGRGGRLYFNDRYIMRTNWSRGIERMIDAADGRTRSLGQNPDFIAAIAALVPFKPEAILMTDRIPVFAELPDTPNWRTGVRLEHYDLMSAANIEDKDGKATIVVLVNRDDATASENARRLKDRIASTTDRNGRPWTQVFSETKVTTAGRVVVATLRGDVLAYQLPVEPLLIHE